MNREETKKAIEVMQAFVAGEEIQYWHDPYWDFKLEKYRAKPKPPEIQLVPREQGYAPHILCLGMDKLDRYKTYTFVLKEDL